MKIAFASDHMGVALREQIVRIAQEHGHECLDFGTKTTDRCDYPEYAVLACKAVQNGEAERALLICGSGVGMSIAAGKLNGIRPVLTMDVHTARMSRRHNNTNVLCLGSRVVGSDLAETIFFEWLSSEYEGGRHQRRLDMIGVLEEGR